jgi:hypothetical protein
MLVYTVSASGSIMSTIRKALHTNSKSHLLDADHTFPEHAVLPLRSCGCGAAVRPTRRQFSLAAAHSIMLDSSSGCCLCCWSAKGAAVLKQQHAAIAYHNNRCCFLVHTIPCSSTDQYAFLQVLTVIIEAAQPCLARHLVREHLRYQKSHTVSALTRWALRNM